MSRCEYYWVGDWLYTYIPAFLSFESWGHKADIRANIHNKEVEIDETYTRVVYDIYDKNLILNQDSNVEYWNWSGTLSSGRRELAN